MAQQKTSEFYWACRNGDVDTVKKILPNLKPNEVNRIESNGSTALHAASYYGHANIVRLLLEHDADTTIRNKYDKTAKEEASTAEIRTLFEQTDDDDDDIPQSEDFQVYRNADGINKSALATRILKARLGTYQAHKYSISAASNIEHLEKKYRKMCEEDGDTEALETGIELLKTFRETGNFDHMLRLYTLPTFFYQIVQDDETFHIEMYTHLLRYDKHRVKGYVYCGGWLPPSDLTFFQWAIDNPNSLVETQTTRSASLVRDVALNFFKKDPLGVPFALFRFNFTQKSCFTAIQLSSFSNNALEEVLILKGTFFSVTGIEKDDNNITVISLVNVPADENVLLTATS
jgi:hypothetical protein